MEMSTINKNIRILKEDLAVLSAIAVDDVDVNKNMQDEYELNAVDLINLVTKAEYLFNFDFDSDITRELRTFSNIEKFVF